jgi:hypothetical protein
MDPTLLADAAVDAAVAVVYAAVGVRLTRRQVAPAARGPAMGFALWWNGLAATGAMAAVFSLAVGLGVRDLPGLLALSFLVAVPFTLGLAGLVYHLAFLYTGRKFLWPIVGIYGAYNALQLANLLRATPTTVVVEGWRPHVVLDPPTTLAFLVLTLVLLLAPPLLAVVGYATLYARVDDPTSRYRIALLAGSIFAWLVSVLLISQPALARADVWQGATRVVVLVSALAILAAYHPPTWVQRRFGVEALAAR